jgi:hypothetical protein
MATKTCMQSVYVRGVLCKRRRPHVVPSATADGYARCEACGVDVYVGQGELSSQAMQHMEHLAALADQRR